MFSVEEQAVMSWPEQADIYAYNYLPHTPAYTTSLVIHPSPIPLSSYSSLSGALDLPPPKSRRRSYSIHTARTSVNTGHPYRVSHRDPSSSPTRSRARGRSNTQSLLTNSNGASNRRTDEESCHHNDESIESVRLWKTPRWPTGPTNHVQVPQRDFKEEYIPKRPSYTDPHFRHPPITFQTVDIPELGVRVGKIVDRYTAPIIGGDDPVFAEAGDREIRFWILWPGYSFEPLQKRIKTRNGTVTRDTVLMIIANALLDYTNNIQRKGIPIEAGYEDWTIGPRADGGQGIVGPSLFITRLHHRGGSVWQPEIWAPRKR